MIPRKLELHQNWAGIRHTCRYSKHHINFLS
jgi:hypothetical protein